MKIGFVYFSNTDVTGTLMRAAFNEVKSQGVTCIFHPIVGAEIIEGRFEHPSIMNELKSCDAIIFGSPTYMGSVSAQFKAFADATSDFWENQEWAGKVAAGITSGANLNGDQSSTLQYLTVLASQHGMIWIGLDEPSNGADKNINRLGCQLGVTSHSLDGAVHHADIETAKYLARRVLNITQQLKSGT